MWHGVCQDGKKQTEEQDTDAVDRAALCQIYDSIFRKHSTPPVRNSTDLISVDVPMAKVKFQVNSEYAYVQNFKVLQSKLSHLILRTSCFDFN
jgi:hypothetical protein